MPGYSYHRKIEEMADSKKEDAWFGIYWRPAAAVIYLVICMFDFVAVPTYLGIGTESLKDLIMVVKELPPESQNVVLTMKLAAWEPLTLKGGGLFHVAFGAILGATVWSRGQERINEIRQNGPNITMDPYTGAPTGPFGTPPNAYSQSFQPPQPPQINNYVQNTTGTGTVDNPDENG